MLNYLARVCSLLFIPACDKSRIDVIVLLRDVTGGMPMLRKDLKNHSDAVWHVVRYARSDGLSVQVVLT